MRPTRGRRRGAGVDQMLACESEHGGQDASGGEDRTSTSAREGLHK
jgi:hypothetical protein